MRTGSCFEAGERASPQKFRIGAGVRHKIPAFGTIPRFVRKNGSENGAAQAVAGAVGGTPVVQLRDVTVVYPGGNVGLDGVSLAIDRGEFAFFVGATGCGKSTFIRLLMKEVEAARGEVLIAGRDIVGLSEKKVPKLRRNIGVVFQDYKLLPNRTVYDNVAYALQVIGASRSEMKRKVPEVLRLVGLTTKLGQYPDQLSGGEQQRVSLARAFVNHPPLLLADEPTGNLDPETSVGIMQLLHRMNRTGTTVVVATHDHAMVDRMRRRVIQLEQGRVIRDERSGLYRSDESTRELTARLVQPVGSETS
jgi:cell division transport system ATP-binding protein